MSFYLFLFTCRLYLTSPVTKQCFFVDTLVIGPPSDPVPSRLKKRSLVFSFIK